MCEEGEGTVATEITKHRPRQSNLQGLEPRQVLWAGTGGPSTTQAPSAIPSHSSMLSDTWKSQRLSGRRALLAPGSTVSWLCDPRQAAEFQTLFSVCKRWLSWPL